MTEGVDPTRQIIRMLIGVLCGAALLLIVMVLSGSELNHTSGKALATAIAFAIFSLTGTAGVNLRRSRREPSADIFGGAVAIVSGTAFLSGTYALWSEPGGDGWKLPVILLVLALGGGHAALLMKDGREEDAEGVRAIRAGVLLAIAALCLMAISEISSNGRQVDPRAFGVLAILYLLGTMVLPLARRSSSSAAESAPPSASELLRANGHILVEGPVSRGGVHGGGKNVCLREPDGTLIEVITYEGG
jgi:peptidoglycan/LPS O-acetylase OafA/YrhL